MVALRKGGRTSDIKSRRGDRGTGIVVTLTETGNRRVLRNTSEGDGSQETTSVDVSDESWLNSTF